MPLPRLTDNIVSMSSIVNENLAYNFSGKFLDGWIDGVTDGVGVSVQYDGLAVSTLYGSHGRTFYLRWVMQTHAQ